MRSTGQPVSGAPWNCQNLDGNLTRLASPSAQRVRYGVGTSLTLRHRLGGYLEYDPPPALAPFCESVWSYKTPRGESGAVHRVLPDPSVNVQFTYLRDTDGHLCDARLVLGVPSLAPALTGFEPGREIVALKVKLEWSAAITGIEAAERRSGGLAFTETRPRLAAALMARLSETRSMHEATLVLIDGLAPTGNGPTPSVASAALDIVRQHNGHCSIERIAARLGVSTRYLRRAVERDAGVTLKRYARIVRLMRAITIADAYPALHTIPWAGVAADTGFYDQSHLIRECHDLCGLTPGEVIAERRDEVDDVRADRAAP
jgi:AraC-like DNA-binding protein